MNKNNFLYFLLSTTLFCFNSAHANNPEENETLKLKVANYLSENKWMDFYAEFQSAYIKQCHHNIQYELLEYHFSEQEEYFLSMHDFPCTMCTKFIGTPLDVYQCTRIIECACMAYGVYTLYSVPEIEDAIATIISLCATAYKLNTMKQFQHFSPIIEKMTYDILFFVYILGKHIHNEIDEPLYQLISLCARNFIRISDDIKMFIEPLYNSENSHEPIAQWLRNMDNYAKTCASIGNHILNLAYDKRTTKGLSMIIEYLTHDFNTLLRNIAIISLIEFK